SLHFYIHNRECHSWYSVYGWQSQTPPPLYAYMFDRHGRRGIRNMFQANLVEMIVYQFQQSNVRFPEHEPSTLHNFDQMTDPVHDPRYNNRLLFYRPIPETGFEY